MRPDPLPIHYAGEGLKLASVVVVNEMRRLICLKAQLYQVLLEVAVTANNYINTVMIFMPNPVSLKIT